LAKDQENIRIYIRYVWIFLAFGKPAGHREVAPREFDVHSRWWTVYHMSSTGVFIEFLILATEPSKKMYSKNSSITHLFRYSIGLMFYWYAKVLVPHF